ncbi:MAG: hypothetical protein HQM09_11390, partial [Candidatus Riflebacteria bacterium]|nr:hypothetical protein [Candidatus Riflebacteria bacterium]
QLRELLEIHGQKLHGDSNYYINKLETLPRRLLSENPPRNIYEIKSDKFGGAVEEFRQIMQKYGKPVYDGKTDKFIDSYSQLEDASVYANIYLNEATPLTPETFDAQVKSGAITDPQDYFKWKNSKGEEGYWKYAPEKAITIKSVAVPYYFENPTPLLKNSKSDSNEDPVYESGKSSFRMRMDYLLRFFKKHNDEGAPPDNYEELRPDDDIEDSPQAPGPPDATGCNISGVRG